jgi:hypothetical protein
MSPLERAIVIASEGDGVILQEARIKRQMNANTFQLGDPQTNL